MSEVKIPNDYDSVVSPWIKVSDQEPPKDKLLLVRYDPTDYDDEWCEGP